MGDGGLVFPPPLPHQNTPVAAIPVTFYTGAARKKQEIGDHDIWCYTTNEPLTSDDFFSTSLALMKVNLKLVVGNLATGQPEFHRWAAGKAFLEMLALFVLGLHEYGCAFALSGAPGFENLIPTNKWPSNPRAGHDVSLWPFPGAGEFLPRQQYAPAPNCDD